MDEYQMQLKLSLLYEVLYTSNSGKYLSFRNLEHLLTGFHPL